LEDLARTDNIWRSTLDILRHDPRITPPMLGFLELAEAKGIMSDNLYLEVPNDLARTMLDQRIRGFIEEALRLNTDAEVPSGFRVTTNPEIEPQFAEVNIAEPVASPRQVSTYVTPAGFETRLNPKYTFENFVLGESNSFARAAAWAVANAPSQGYNPLFIHGNSGLGKTHLLHAIGNEALVLYPHFKVRYVSSEEFTNHYINAITNNRLNEFQEEYRQVDILLIDDIQFLQGKDQTQETFFHTFENLYRNNKQVVISSDVSPQQLTGFEARMTSRFEMGLMLQVSAPALETRIAILRKKAELEKVRIPDEIFEYIAERVSSNVRELEGTLIRITAFANLSRTPIDMNLVKSVLKDRAPVSSEVMITPLEIMNAVASYYGITVNDLTGNSRVAQIAIARQVAMYICREQTNLSLPKIGQLFGNRDHTTVMYAFKKIGDLMGERRAIYNVVADLTDTIKSNNR
jgi:chromosomal replication initiator protein